jgi:hypothetical protein
MWMDFLGRYSEKVASPLERILVPGLIWSQLNSRHLSSGTCTGAMWTPGYWELHDDGPYVFCDGYWASEVGWYGGINYGFGYQGVGFAFGEWRNALRIWHRLYEFGQNRDSQSKFGRCDSHKEHIGVVLVAPVSPAIFS